MSRKLLASGGVLVLFAIVTAIFINVSSGDAYEFAGGEITPAKAARSQTKSQRQEPLLIFRTAYRFSSK